MCIRDRPTVELTAAWNVGETAVGSESQRQKFYAQYPRPKAIYDFARSEAIGADEPDSEVGDSGSAELHRPHGGSVKTGTLDLQAS